MDEKERRRIQLNALYEMFRDRIDEDCIYIVYTENEGKIQTTVDHLMSIAASAFTGHHFETKPLNTQTLNGPPASGTRSGSVCSSNSSCKLAKTPAKVANLIDGKQIEDDEEEESDDLDEPGLTVSEQIEKLQKSIDNLLEEKNSYHSRVPQYHTKKMYAVVSYYSEAANQCRKMIEKKTNLLVELLLEKCKDSESIDLHGLNPVQAQLVVGELLKIRKHKLMIDKQGEASIDIITGWGKHSVTQGQRIRPTIVKYLRDQGFQYDYLNKGALRVTIKRT